MIRVKATREGLIGKQTASGYIIDKVVPFVALPSTKAVGRFLKITNPANGIFAYAIVLDVGPWNVHDEGYVFGGGRPLTEYQRASNGSGIDLGERVWHQLVMLDNTDVEWEFI